MFQYLCIISRIQHLLQGTFLLDQALDRPLSLYFLDSCDWLIHILIESFFNYISTFSQYIKCSVSFRYVSIYILFL